MARPRLSKTDRADSLIFSRSNLPGGARVVSERMPNVLSASIGFWIAVGSRDEPPEIQGASHLLEHLLFKGTETRSARDIAEAFDSIGGEANAFSAKEYTCFYARILNEDLPMAFETLGDMLTNAALRGSDLESERRVVLEEIAMRDDTPDDMVHELFAETLFGDHPLSREVMGTAETVGRINTSDLKDFYKNNYQGPNLVIAAAGDVDHERLVEWTENAFTTGKGPVSHRGTSVPSPARKRSVLVKESEQAHIVLGGFGLPRHHPDRFAWGVLDDLLGGGNSSRLFQQIREERGLAYSVFSYRSLFIDTGLWGLYAGTAPSNAEEVLKLLHAELDRLVDEGVSEHELKRAKGRSRGSLVLSLEDPGSRMSRLGRSELVHGEILSVEELLARVEAVSLEDVSRIARQLLREDNRFLTVVGPASVSELGV